MCCVLRNIKYFIMLLLSFSDWQVCAEDSSSFYPFDKALRQYPDKKGRIMDGVPEEAFRFTEAEQLTTIKEMSRTTPMFLSQYHYCDHLARPCIHSYVTGKICARTIQYYYATYETYCQMDYVNCREGFEMWQMVHAGGCFELKHVTEYMFYAYRHDYFMDNYYIINEKSNPKFYENDEML